MTFCTYYETCATPCSRALTPQVEADAEKWMKNAPICMYSEKPTCYNTKESNEED